MLTKEQLEKVREIQITLLDAFVKICEDNCLTYFVVGGTALGAVRHKGYIPWDDDIDVGMPRQDYDKFAQVAQKQLPGNMFYQSIDTEPEYKYFFAKIRHNDSVLLESCAKHLNINHGVYIDVFPFDGCSNSFKTATRQVKKVKFYMRLLYVDVARRSKNSQTFLKKTAAFLLKVYSKILGEKRIKKRMNKLLYRFSVSDSTYAGCLLGSYRTKEILEKEKFVSADGETARVKFCGKEYSAPYKVHDYLESIYGDYMKLPPLEKQVSHHEIEKFEII